MKMNDSFIAYVCSIIADTNSGLSGSEIVKYCNSFAVKFSKTIKFTNNNFEADNRLYSKREALHENFKSFDDHEKYFIINELCANKRFASNNDVKIICNILKKDYSNFNTIDPSNEVYNIELVVEVKHILDKYKKSKKLYVQSIENLRNGANGRHIVDDIRLSLELLLKEIFKNDKSLENQKSNIGNLVSSSGASKEFSNMFIQLIEYYTRFQNAYVKHDDKINKSEIVPIVDLTSVFMKSLINMIV